MYQVTKHFTTGSMKGLTITEKTTVKFFIGETVKGIGGSNYKIVSCLEV